jgi:hypothetical protein
VTGHHRIVILVAAAGWAAAVAGGVAGLVMLALQPLPHVDTTFGLGASGMIGFVVLGISWATVGALLVARRPGNVIGRYMVIIGAGYALSILTGVIAFHAIDARDVALARSAGWLAVLTSSIGELTLYLAFIFPTGRGHTRGWDLAGRAFLVGLIVTMAWLLFQPGPLHLFPGVDNPLGFGPDLRPLLGTAPARIVLALGLVTVPIVVAAVVSRYRAADSAQRVQLKWVLSAIVLSLAALTATAVAAMPDGARSEAPIALYAVAGSLVAVAIGVAILRYHLYDIDRIISRSLSWAIISGILVVVFAGAMLLLQAMLAGFTQGQTVAVATSTLVAFALFQPVRRRVQVAIDRRFDRTGYDQERVVAAFSESLRHEVDLEALSSEIRQAASDTVRPASIGVWLRIARDRPRASVP